MYGNTYPFAYLSLGTRELVGQPFSSHCVLFDGEDVRKQFYLCHIFKITKCHQPLGSFVKSFSVTNRSSPGNFQEMSSERAVFLRLVFDSSYHLRPVFPKCSPLENMRAFVIRFSVRQHQWNLRHVVIWVDERAKLFCSY